MSVLIEGNETAYMNPQVAHEEARQFEVSDLDLSRCPDCDCDCGEGELHLKGCNLAICSVCGRRVEDCGVCKGHDRRLPAWTSKPLTPIVSVPDYSPKLRPLKGRPKTKPPQPRKTANIVYSAGLIRYPGGKCKMLKDILPRMESMFRELSPTAEYREVFLGGGAVAHGFLRSQPDRPAWLNDGDPALVALCDSVLNRTASLSLMVQVFPDIMNERYFYFLKKILRRVDDPAELRRHDRTWIGFAKLVIHQMSISGFGTRSGGPMGGFDQCKREFASRYNPELICSKINSFRDVLSARSLRSGSCTCLDFSELFLPGDAGFYLDPPYYKKGPGVYQHFFHHEDHVRLASILRQEERPWLMSYDRHPVIAELYSGWSKIDEVPAPYSAGKSTTEMEYLISNR